MTKHCKRCGDELNPTRTNQRYCPHCADVAEFERRLERLKLSPTRRQTLSKARRFTNEDD